jgi:hypothetical protein
LLLSYNVTTFISNIDTKLDMSAQKTANKSEHKSATDSVANEPKLTDKALSNLSELDLTLTTTSAYFKPEDSHTYMIQINPEDKVEMIRNPKFADKDGYIPTRFEFKVKHINNGAEHLWTVSKTVCKQMVTELGKGFTVLQITRHGSDRSTIYDIKGV